MALQVWLPLTKDLRNQGLSDVTVINNGATYLPTGGKLGGCYSFDRTVPNYLKIDNPLTTATNGVSMSFWMKIVANGSVNDQVVHIGNGSGWDNNRFTCFVRSGTSKLIFCCGDGTNSTYYNCISSALSLNQWTHVICAYGSNIMKIYLNGIEDKTYTISFVPSFNNVAYIGVGAGPNAAEPTTVSINDVRIYDHCLSPMEIRQLSQGLILHYPLNRQGWGQENLLPVSGSTIIDSTRSFEFQGWVQNFYTKTWMNEHLTPGKQYTLSYTVTCLSIPDSTYTFKENRASPILVHQGGGGWSQITTTSDGIKDTNMSVGQSRDYKCTFTFATATENYEYYGLCGYTALYRNSSNNTQYARFRIDNLKLEEGSIVTPWCPNSSDTFATTMGLNGTTEYDCSGFGNNGTRTGTFSWTSDTPKYEVSQYFNGSSYILTDSGSFTWFDFSQCTIAAWLNPTIKPSAYSGSIGIAHNQNASHKYFAISNYGGNFVVNSVNGSSYVNTNSYYTLPLNEWHHCVATLDGTTVKIYVDGELKNTAIIDWGSSGIATDTRVNIGTDLPGTDEMYTGYYSDVRIYATALSASDVKSLYQNCATIDPDGTIRGQIRS